MDPTLGPRVAAEALESVTIGDYDVGVSRAEADDALRVRESKPADDSARAINEVVSIVRHP